MTIVTTTKEAVLEAADKCSISKGTLEILFPEVFENPMVLKNGGIYGLCSGGVYVMTRISGNYYLVNLKTGSIKTSGSDTMRGAFSYDFDDAEYLGQGSTALRAIKAGMSCRL